MKNSGIMKLSLFIFLILGFNPELFSQVKEGPVPDMPGTWDYTFLKEAKGSFRGENNYELTPAELTIFEQKINQVLEVLHQNPVLKNPKGFSATVEACVWTDIYENGFDKTKLTEKPAQSQIIIRFCPLYRNKNGAIHKGCIEVAHSDVMLNNPWNTTDSYMNFGSDGYNHNLSKAAKKINEVFLKPEVVKELAPGVTAYSNGFIVVSRTDRTYWIPVTVGELYDLLLNYWKLDAAQSGYSGVLDVYQKEKDKLTPEQLNSPAYFTNENIPRISADPNSGTAYMRLNPNYFDKSLPRNHVQLITIKAPTDAFNEPPRFKDIDYLRSYEFTKALDGNLLHSLLDAK